MTILLHRSFADRTGGIDLFALDEKQAVPFFSSQYRLRMVDYKEMGLRIKRLRRSKDLTQENLAAITGYSKSFQYRFVIIISSPPPFM